jgi:hypothetical protein
VDEEFAFAIRADLPDVALEEGFLRGAVRPSAGHGENQDLSLERRRAKQQQGENQNESRHVAVHVLSRLSRHRLSRHRSPKRRPLSC